MDLNQLVKGKDGDKEFLLGNEATVRGAIEAGVSIAATYPGTPTSEIGNIFSVLAKDAGIFFEFSINEKVAMEVGASSSASGLKTLVFMKHVGLNVASDSFMSAVYTGTPGGMVVLVADEPSMFSSQNEQDTRNYARLANCPVLEPSNPQEIKDMMKYGYELSREFSIPVIIRTTTRVSHMRGVVEFEDISDEEVFENSNNNNQHLQRDSSPVHWKKGFFKKNKQQFVPVPQNAGIMHEKLIAKMIDINKVSNSSKLNTVFEFNNSGNKRKLGLIAGGSAFNYAYDVINGDNLEMDILKLGFTYPFPKNLVLDFVKDLDGIIVVEEVDPIVEKEILVILGEAGLNIPVYGKINGTFPMPYEYNCNIVRDSINKIINENGNDLDNSKELELNKDLTNLKNNLPDRLPTLCAGCSHRATYFGVRRAMDEMGIANEDLIFSSDIGCYTLGISPPYETTDYLLSMGASIGDACGFSAGTNQYIVSFIGDSTFFHGGIPQLINGVHNKHRFVVTVLDNRTTGMTGGQPHPGLPVDGMGDFAPEISIEKIAKASECEFVETINPMLLKQTVDTYKRALKHDGVAVIIAKHPCTLIKGLKRKKPMTINQDKCNNCKICIDKLACPAISVVNEKVIIDHLVCKGCAVCVQVCDERAIVGKKN
ncbi:MAG: indolepyruvate ferredoxin oxidoreductase subunit alpha [Methanobrevibacter sp.]|nr:indolepyruvate ferredoxin oxidoreductase subunit alpha [Methanobrevibacter sp.]